MGKPKALELYVARSSGIVRVRGGAIRSYRLGRTLVVTGDPLLGAMPASFRLIPWLPDRSGIGHATKSGFRMLCGAGATPARLARPEDRRCPACEAIYRSTALALQRGEPLPTEGATA